MARVMPIRRGIVLSNTAQKNASNARVSTSSRRKKYFGLLRQCIALGQDKHLRFWAVLATVLYALTFIVYSLCMWHGHYEYKLMQDTRKRNERLTMQQFQHASLQSIHQIASGIQKQGTVNPQGLLAPQVILTLPKLTPEMIQKNEQTLSVLKKPSLMAWHFKEGQWVPLTKAYALHKPVYTHTFEVLQGNPYWQRRF
jgi:hypothetical protein